MNDYMEIANSPIMWVACSLPIFVIAFQAILFVKRGLSTAKKVGITNDQIRKAVRNSAITSIGPSVVRGNAGSDHGSGHALQLAAEYVYRRHSV